MYKLLNSVKTKYSQYTFQADQSFIWSPINSTISYVEDELNTQSGVWSLFHELGHASLDHQSYRDDFELLIMEVKAWAKAKELAKNFNIKIDENHIEQCIESYRTWLHNRSTCIDCKSVSFQLNKTTYSCHNCGASWKVPLSKLTKVKKTRILSEF